MKGILKTFWFLLFLFIVCFFLRLVSLDSCKYSNATGSLTFQAMPNKSRDLTMLKSILKTYKKNGNKDTIIYRTFEKRYWKFWLWLDYWQSEYFDYPYMNWKIIKQRRGEVENLSPYQDF